MPSARFRPLVAAVLAALGAVAHAGGSAENAVLIVDPGDPDALAVANTYLAARDLPAQNVLFMRPLDDAGFAANVDRQLAAFAAELERRGLAGHVAFVVLAPQSTYRAAAGGLLTDGCHPVGHLSATTVYAVQPFAAEVAAGGGDVTRANPYFDVTGPPRALDPSTGWTDGVPDATAAGRRIYVASMLGYTGTRGNSVAELRSALARAAGVDGTFPEGTFSFHRTGDTARSGPRHDHFSAVRAALEALGASTVEDVESVPKGRHDVLGCMTGAASPKVATEDFTILPGAFCDHLTSWAADFDRADQTKVSAWIARGACLSAGAVEEPCNYPGKFPRPELHLFAFQGLTLGEAYLRATAYVPFQALLYGDPLTRPFAHVPVVSPVAGLDEPVDGTVALALAATTSHPTAAIARFVVLVDGREIATVDANGGAATFDLDTTDLADGVHDLRLLAEDDSLLRTAGRRTAVLRVDRHGRSTAVTPLVATGSLVTALRFRLDASGGEVAEIRLLHESRVVASTTTAGGEVTVHGRMLGSGHPRLHAEATFRDGRCARGAVVTVEVTDDAPATTSAAPLAYDALLPPLGPDPRIVELPASFPDPLGDATYTVVAGPAHGVVLPGATGPFRLVRANPDAPSTDSLTFRVTTAGGMSRTATLQFGAEPTLAVVQLSIDVAKLRDRRRAARDTLVVQGVFDPPGERGPARDFDPASEALRIAVGDPGEPLVLDVPAGDPGWRSRRGSHRYRSPRAARPRFDVRLDPATGELRVVVQRLDVATPPASLRLAVTAGERAAEASGLWEERPGRPGRFRLAD